MWIMTKHGFYSAVQHRDDAEQLLVRSRSLADLHNLIDLGINAGVFEHDAVAVEYLQHADYPYRVQMSKEDWGHLLLWLTDDIDYDNFKNAVAQTNTDRAHTYHQVWRVLHDIEQEPTAGGYDTAPEPTTSNVTSINRKARS